MLEFLSGIILKFVQVKLISNFCFFQVLLKITGFKIISSEEPKNAGKLSFICNFFVVIIVS
jgi:heme/copper-type cytochrome/quinol oxidase subunit 4